VEKNLKNGVYSSTIEFAGDIRKIWNNAYQYNAPGSEIHSMTNEMSNYFEKLYKDIENITLQGSIHLLQKKLEKLSKEIKDLHNQKGTIRSQPPMKANKPGSILQKPMTNTEKRELCQLIKSLPLEFLRGVWQIISESTWQLEQEELEFDLELLPVQTQRELERYVKAKHSLSQKRKVSNKAAEGNQNIAPLTNFFENDNEQPPESDKLNEPWKESTLENDMIPTQPVVQNENEDAISKGTETSFITDSDDVISDFDYQKDSQKEDTSIFQAGEHGSMLSSFLIK